MQPTTILSDEHRVIEVVLECLDRIAQQAADSGRLDQESAEQAVDFFRTFADGCHHGKEEKHLFPAMVAKGVPQNGGPVGVMLAEHDQGRRYISAMSGSIAEASKGEPDAIDAFTAAARAYSAMLRSHIMKEDQILFPLAARILTEDDERSLMNAYDHVEHHHMGAGTHERYLELAVSLASKYDVSSEALDKAKSHGSCGCHHAKKG
ncbi:MAG: hemerythrin domain-containing protein [candidate division Zixibacteria bacterium]|jgi:hemerythrin-like domain-containing protein|nr:hemerythrin domain-containing protein [candidate division Zixibacteria bacterium]